MSSSNFVPPTSVTFPTAPQTGYVPPSPFVNSQQPESLIPQAAMTQQQNPPVFQTVPSQQVPVSPSTPFPSVESQSQAPVSKKLVLSPQDIQNMAMFTSGEGKFSVPGLATYFYKRHFNAIEGSVFSKGKDYAAWIFPTSKKSEVETLLARIKSGELPPSSEEELKQEKKEARQKRQTKLQEKKKQTVKKNKQSQMQGASQVMNPFNNGFQQGFQQAQMMSGFNQTQSYPMGQGFNQMGQMQPSLMSPNQFGYPSPQQSPFNFVNSAPFGQTQSYPGGQMQQKPKFKEAKHKIMGDFQIIAYKLFRPQVGYTVRIKMDTGDYHGVVVDAPTKDGGIVTTCNIRLSSGSNTMVHVVEGKWKVMGFDKDHGIYFNGGN